MLGTETLALRVGTVAQESSYSAGSKVKKLWGVGVGAKPNIWRISQLLCSVMTRSFSVRFLNVSAH